MAQSLIFWFLLGLIYFVVVGILHLIPAVRQFLTKYGIAPMTFWIWAFTHLYAAICISVFTMVFDFGYLLKNKETWVIAWFSIALFFMICLFIIPIVLAVSVGIWYNKIKKGGIWYYSNEAFFYWGLKETFFPQFYIPFDLMIKFLILIFIISIKNYTFVTVVITGFLCIAHGTVLFIIRPFKLVGYNIAAVLNSVFVTVFYFLMELFDNEDLMSGENF